MKPIYDSIVILKSNLINFSDDQDYIENSFQYSNLLGINDIELSSDMDNMKFDSSSLDDKNIDSNILESKDTITDNKDTDIDLQSNYNEVSINNDNKFDLNSKKEEYEIDANAKKEADELVSNAKKEADELVSNAKKEADELVSNAKKEADELVSNAKKEASLVIEKQDNIVKDKIEELDKQRKINTDKLNEDIVNLRKEVENVISSVINKKFDILDSNKQIISNILLTSLRKIVKKVTDSDKHLVIRSIEDVLGMIRSKTDVVIRINPDDKEISNECLKNFKSSFDKIDNISLVSDSSIDKGGCIVEYNFGTIDSRIHTQLLNIESKILGSS